MPSFRIREGSIPLFGVVDSADQEPFHAAFADPAWPERDWLIDDDVLDTIADEFDEDLDGSAYELQRYCTGRFRSKTQGPGGNRLGTIGEALAWLALDGPSGRLIRVVDWRPPGGKVVKGIRYVQPDFIERTGATDGAVEVKSTEQVRFRRMTQANQWQHLRSCAGVAGCRDAALEQLGFTGTTTPIHLLELQGGQIIAFPVGRATAVTILARDGRIDSLRADPRFRTPPACRGAKRTRDCWRCMAPNGTKTDLSLIRMDNSPDRLPFVGGGGEQRESWAQAYFQWARSLWARDEQASGQAARELARVVDRWLREALPRGVDALPFQAFWGSYLLDAASERGLAGAAAEVPLPTLADLTGQFDWSRALPQEPSGQYVSLDQLASVAAQFQGGGLRRLYVPASAVAGRMLVDVGFESCSARVIEPRLGLGESISLEAAERLAARAAAAVLVGGGWLDSAALVNHGLRVPLGQVVATLGEARRELGWVGRWPAPKEPESGPYFRNWLHHLRRPFRYPFPFGWGLPIGQGPDLKVRVTRSGRATATCVSFVGESPA